MSGDAPPLEAGMADVLTAGDEQFRALAALAQLGRRGAGERTVGLLLDRALELTASSLVVLFEGDTVCGLAGDSALLAEGAAAVSGGVADTPSAVLRRWAAGAAMIGTLEPDDGVERHVAFVREPGRPFSTADTPLVDAIVSVLGVVLAFDRFRRRERERGTVEREHRIASSLAQSVLASRPPRSDTIDIFATTVPASRAGGDFYVFSQSEGSIWFAVGDVAGSGLPAAMLMTRVVSACRAAFPASGDASAVEVFTRVEDELFDHLDAVGLFVTLAVGVVDEETRAVSLVNAGHSPVVHVDGRRAALIPASAPPLGVPRERAPRVSTLRLGRGSGLVIGTDGLVEQTGADGAMLGYDRFRALCGAAGVRTASGLGKEILGAVHAFAGGSPASDDATLVVLAGAEAAR